MFSPTFDWKAFNVRLRAITARTESLACDCKTSEGKSTSIPALLSHEVEILLRGLLLGGLHSINWPTQPGIYILYLLGQQPQLVRYQKHNNTIEYFGRATVSHQQDPDMRDAKFLGPVQFLAETAMQ